MDAAPTVSAFRKSVSSRPSALRRKPSCRRTPSGAARTHQLMRNSTAHMANHYHHKRIVILILNNSCPRRHQASSNSSNQASIHLHRQATSSSQCMGNLFPRKPVASAALMSRTRRLCRLLTQVRNLNFTLTLVRRLILTLPRTLLPNTTPNHP